MTVTRRLDEEDYRFLVKQLDGDTVDKWWLRPLSFDPPRPDGEADKLHTPKYTEKQAFPVLQLNVLEPMLYKDPHDTVFVVLPWPAVDEYTYDDLANIHTAGYQAWGYVLYPDGWSLEHPSIHDSANALWWFSGDEFLPDFDADNTATH